MNTAIRQSLPWIFSVRNWLTCRRIRAQAIVLAVCTWGVCAIDFAAPGLRDRAGNIKFQDFLPIYVSAKLVAMHRSADLFNAAIQQQQLQAIAGPSQVQLPYLYGPQVALFFVPFASLSFQSAAAIWAALSLAIYAVCVYSIWIACPSLRKSGALVCIAAAAFPPLFHVFVRGQISSLILVCFTASFLAFNRGREWLGGVALGLLLLKPQFLVAIPFIFLFARAWKALLGCVLSIAIQFLCVRLYFGPLVLPDYVNFLRHSSQWVHVAELSLAPIQMHSLRSFWTLLIPSPAIAFVLYAATSIAAIFIAARAWRVESSWAIRFSSLTLAAVLVNPHLFIYDLIVLAPILLLVVDESMGSAQKSASSYLLVLSYLVFLLPLLGPVSRWTHIQVSVLAMAALLWTLFSCETRGHKLA